MMGAGIRPGQEKKRSVEETPGQLRGSSQHVVAASTYRKAAGVREEVTLHSLRAGFITQLAKAGLNAVAIKRLARHRSIETSLRYIEATGESFRRDWREHSEALRLERLGLHFCSRGMT